MDWFSWLSRTSLEPSLIYEYGLAFARNELQLEDATYFNHEFLQSMGISIAKHRLEILKLAKKEELAAKTSANKLSGVIKKCLRKCFSKLVSKEDHQEVKEMPPEPNWYQGKWRRARHNGTIALSGPLDANGRIVHEKMVSNSKVMKLSGPLDGKVNGGERVMYANANRSPIMGGGGGGAPRPLDGRFMGSAKSPRLSGPLDARPVAVSNNRSPRLPRALDERAESPMGYSPYNKVRTDHADYDDDYAMWPSLFEDLKPT